MILSASECAFCQNGELRSFRAIDSTGPGTLNIVECERCQVAWQFPVKYSAKDGTAFFDAQYADSSTAVTDYFLDDERISVAMMQMEFVSSVANGSGTLLDVGAGMGYFVSEAAKRGWRVLGIELADEAVTKSQSVIGANVIKSTLADLPATSRFDVITMWDVIEHLEKPLQEVAEAWRRLKPGGWLVIETGNYQSAVRVELDEKWWLWQGDHRWYFAPPLVEAMLRNLGCNQVAHAATVFRNGYNKDKQPHPSIGRLIKSIVRTPAAFSLHLRRYRKLRQAYREWPNWVELPIFTIAGRKSV